MRSSRLTTGGLAFALLALVAIGIVLALPAGATAPDERRSLTVVGSGAVTATPDVAEWSFGVRTDAPTAAEALRANSAAMQKVLDALTDAGISSADLRTEQVSVFRNGGEEGFDTIGETTPPGFTATNTVHTTIRNVATAGDVIDIAVGAGANQVFGPTLTVSDSETPYAQALELAYDAALAKAERLAEHAGLSVGEALTIEEAGASPIAVAAQDGAEESVPVAPGQSRIEATLTVTFAVS